MTTVKSVYFATGEADRWLPAVRDVQDPWLRLFCFPHAGGAPSVFARWPSLLPTWIEVRTLQLPGRGARLCEPSLTDVDAIVARLAPILRPLLDRPFVLFGHSMGALLAFEMARLLQRNGRERPAHLVVSGRRAAQIPDLDVPAADATDAELVESLRRLEGTPAQILENAEAMSVFLPSLRADFAVVRSYRCVSGPPLTCPITVFGGSNDVESAPGYLEGWFEQKTEKGAVKIFPGGHFFLQSAGDAVVAALAASILETLAP